jgi:hypothetical protein
MKIGRTACVICGAVFLGTAVVPHECRPGGKDNEVFCPVPPRHHADVPERHPAPMRTLPIAAAASTTMTSMTLVDLLAPQPRRPSSDS